MSKGFVKLRRGIASLWTSVNPVLLDGELAVDKTNGRFKIGDGVTAWNSLPYSITKMLTTSGAPSNGFGVDGDYAVDLPNKNWYGPKAAGVWPGAQTMQGIQGVQGNPGTNGQGVPAGGTTGQYLNKINNTDYNTQWSTLPDSTLKFDRLNGTLTGVAGPTHAAGKLVYDTDNESLTFYNNDANVSMQVGQESWIRVRNVSGSTINNGQAVYINGANTGLPTIALAQANAVATSVCVGLATENIANNSIGYVTALGSVRGLNTSAFTAGATVYLSESVAGGLTATRPTAPNFSQRIGVVAVSDTTVGTIHVSPAGTGVGDGTRGDMLVMNSGTIWRQTNSLYAAGAVGDGTTNDRAAFVSLDGSLPANHGIFVDGGRYRITSNLTITRPLMFGSGGRIVVPTGITVTINAPISAECEQIFELEGTGAVVLSARFNVDRYAEWWGAFFNADCAIPFQQCIVSGTRTLLQARDYNTTATMMVPAYAVVQGAGCHYEGDGTATRVLMIGGTNTIVQLGSSTGSPPDLNSAPCGATVLDVYFGRNAQPNANTVGCLIGWSRAARMERCRVTNSITNFRVSNAISPFLVDLFSKRDVAIAGGQGADKFIAYHIDGTGTLPAAGGNASVWLTRPQAELNLTIADSTAYYINGRFTDVFVTQPECLGTSYGIDVMGDKAGSPNAGSNCNLTIENPVVDQTKVLGIRIQNVNQWGVVQLLQPYIGPSTGDGMYVFNCDGHVGISQGLLRMNVSASGKGVTFDTCRSPRLEGTHIAECATQALILTNIQGGSFTPIIQNVTATCAAAVQSTATVTRSTIRPSINGGAGKVAIAHQSQAATNQNNVISLVGVASGVVTTLQSYVAGAELGTVFPESDTTIARKTANQAMTATGQTAVTDLAVPLAAGASYSVEIVLNVGAVTGTSPTMNIGLTGPASPTAVSLRKEQMSSATAVGYAMYTAFAAAALVAQVANTMHIIKGTIVNGANAGTLQVTVAMGGTTPNATILAGSHIILTRTSVT